MLEPRVASQNYLSDLADELSYSKTWAKLILLKVCVASCTSISFDPDRKVGPISLWIGKDQPAIHFCIVCEVSHDDFCIHALSCVVTVQDYTLGIPSCAKAVVTAWVGGTVF